MKFLKSKKLIVKTIFNLSIILFFLHFTSCNENNQAIDYVLTDFDTSHGDFYIQGVSVIDPTDTFAQEFIIPEQPENVVIPPSTYKYRVQLIQDIFYMRHKEYNADTFYIMLSKRTKDRYDQGTIRYFKFDSQYGKLIHMFKNEDNPLHVYYLLAK